MQRKTKIALFALLIIFAGIGLLFTGVFVAMQFDLLNVRGSILERNAFFTEDPASPAIASINAWASTISCFAAGSTCVAAI